MSLRTGVVSGSDLDNLRLKTLKSAKNHFNRMKSGGHFFCFENKTLKCKTTDLIRGLSEMSSDELGGDTLRNLLLNSLVSTETKQSSSGIICMQTLLFLLENYIRYQGLSSIELKEIKKDIAAISNSSYRASSEEIFEMLSQTFHDDVSRDIAMEAIACAGANGTIHLDSGSEETTIIKKIRGYNFPIEIPEVFLAASELKVERSYINPKICVIDGVIEKVSEINGLVQKSYENHCPLIIVARGFDKDVQNTLGVNFSSGNLSIIPVVVPYDMFGANLVNDIAVVSGADKVSSLKGDIISAINWDNIVSVENIKVDSKAGTLTIINKSTENTVRLHRRFLRDKKEKASGFEEMGANIFDQRLGCLVGHGVVVSLGRDLGDSWGITKDRVESYIRSFRDASRFGLVNISNLSDVVTNSHLKLILRSISKTTNIVISRALLVGLKIGIDASQSIGRVGGIVYIDR